jgi:hypothetical protein
LLLNIFAELLICSSFEVLLRSNKQKKNNFSADLSFKSYGDPLIFRNSSVSMRATDHRCSCNIVFAAMWAPINLETCNEAVCKQAQAFPSPGA